MSNQTLSFEAYYADYKIAATNAGIPVLGKELIYFAFASGITPDDAANQEAEAAFEAQHLAFTDDRGFSLKEQPHRLEELLAELDPRDLNGDEDGEDNDFNDEGDDHFEGDDDEDEDEESLFGDDDEDDEEEERL